MKEKTRGSKRPMRCETWHVLHRKGRVRGGLIDTESFVALARAEGLSDRQIRQLVGAFARRRRAA